MLREVVLLVLRVRIAVADPSGFALLYLTIRDDPQGRRAQAGKKENPRAALIPDETPRGGAALPPRRDARARRL